MKAFPKRKVTEIQTSFNEGYANREIALTKKRKLLYRRLAFFLVIVSFVSYLFISSLFNQAKTLEAKQMEKQQLEEKLVDLNKEQESLENELIKLNDEEYLSKLARRDYFLSKEGEIIFNIPDSED